MSIEHAQQRGGMPLAVSPAEAAKLAGIGRTSLYQAISSGDLASFKIGSRRLVRISVLDAWLASHEAETKPISK